MESLEEGQILQDDSVHGGYYDPAFEWPGDEVNTLYPGPQESSTSVQGLRPGHPAFRLVVWRSSILPAKHKVAVLDGYAEAQLGRDLQPEGSGTPRIRLKEMEVSKLHATMYWDGARKEWNVVDMGSKHGTFLHPGPVSPDSDGLGTRLSPSRTASVPRRLRHSDHLSIGGTTFVVHIHEDQRPCEHCTLFGEEGIPLFPTPKGAKRTRDSAALDSDSSGSSRTSSIAERDPKKALTMLKRSLLTRHDSPKSGSSSGAAVETSNEYVDRAARRRLLHTSTRPSTPQSPALSSVSVVPAGSPFITEQPSAKPVLSQPPAPLPSSNIGHRLLMQQGWAPGSALGISTPQELSDGQRINLVDPLEVAPNQHRAGLGMKPISAHGAEHLHLGADWKERGKLRRFASLK
ncbi:hypothetical protein NLJ89_g1727 [Agrocybe chaxingu]|uniref:Angiogenic factor with G patch and FHA domains 1 n=1 Tax=Agrocybe chaxingu TaxID=84603 RepID=A0A9W8TER3_9AGAR|nr:hypothetical protein NLJ89_g1727 [Agrocybe chaxingu]